MYISVSPLAYIQHIRFATLRLFDIELLKNVQALLLVAIGSYWMQQHLKMRFYQSFKLGHK
jgi:uncharacterized membrane protein